MVIGIIGAMEEEVAALREAMENARTSRVAGMEFTAGTLCGAETVVVQCGMGKVNAGVCAQTLISRFGAGGIINTGVAGPLDARIDIGDIVVSSDAVQHDFDVSPIGFRKGEIPYTGLYAFPADPGLRERALSAAKTCAPDVRCFEGRVCSGDQFIASGVQKARIVAEFGGLCCEMEGAAIAQVCHLNGVPWVILRAISDKADDSEEVSFETFLHAAARRCTAIVREMLIQFPDTGVMPVR